MGLHVRDVAYSYKETGFHLSGIDLSVANGEVVCLLGPSGCGKSTVLRLISGLNKVREGSITVNGSVLDDGKTFVPTEKRNVSLIFQHPSLFSHQTVIENVEFAIRNLPRTKKREFAASVLESVGILEHANSYPHMLSGGQQQLVTIARALAQQPAIVLLDEPFSNLDVVLKRQTRSRIISSFRAQKIVTLVVTHDPEEALEISDMIYVMRDGHIVQSGTPHDIYYTPKDHMLARFFGEVNRLYAVVEGNQVKSPLGAIPAGEFGDGESVVVAIRPEAILSVRSSKVKAVVKDIKFFSNMIYVEVGDNVYWMRYPLSLSPSKGDTVFVSLDLNKVLLFKV